MATNDEVVRYVYEVSGSKELKAIAEQLLQVGEVSKETAASVQKLADEFSQAKSASGAVDAYRALVATQAELADAVDRTGLRLKYATEQEQSNAAALRETQAAVIAAKQAQQQYGEQADKSATRTKELADAVRAANAEQKQAQQALKESTSDLDRSTKAYERAAEAQDQMLRAAKPLADQIEKAGQSTEDLGKAQRELAKQSDAASKGLDHLVAGLREVKQQADSAAAESLAKAQEELARSAEDAARAEARLAAAQAESARAAQVATQAQDEAVRVAARRAQVESAFIDDIRKSAAQQKLAARATENLERARDLLSKGSTSASASERTYSQALGTSAAKIAAIGAAALGINSAVGLARTGLSQLIDTAGEFQKLDVQLDSVFKGDSAAAFDKITQFAKETPYQLNQVADSFVKLKAFGLDPLDGTFQAIADQAAALGGAQETLTGITLALGQAQAKGKLQGEEILQLVERGVPVWDLLAKATGKSTAELQKLSAAGKLGRTEIKLLIEEIGKSAEGTSAALANTLPGQINRLKTQYQEFLNLVANSGVLDYLTQQLKDISAEVQRLADSGELQQWAKEVAEAIVSAAKAIGGITVFLVEHRDAILAMAAAYGAFKGAQLIGGLATAFASLATRVVAGTVAIQGATAATVGMAGPLGLLAAALAFTANASFNLVDAMQKVKEVNTEVAAAQLDLVSSNADLAAKSKESQTQYAAFADVVIAKSTELATKSADDTQAYIGQLKGAIQYTQALGLEAIATGDNVGKIAARTKLTELRAALEAAKQQMVDLRDVSALAFESIGPFGIKAAEAFDGIIASGKSAKDAVDSIFKDVNFTQQEGLVKAAAAVAAIGSRGTEAAAAIRTELRAEILKLSDEDFAKFQAASRAAFAAGVQGGDDLKKAIEGINLARLGVDIEEIKTGFSTAGKAAIEAFAAARAEVETLGLNAEQKALAIGQAFDKAFGQAKTKADLQAIGDQLRKAFADGEIGVDNFKIKVDEVNAKLANIGKGPGTGDAGKGAIEKATGAVQQLGDASTQAGDQAAAATGKVVEEATAGASNAAQAIQDIYSGFANELGKTSQAATDRFTKLTRDIFELSAGIADFSGLARFAKAASDAFAIVSKEIETQKLGVTGLSQSYADLTDAAILAQAKSRGGFEQVAAGLAQAAEEARNGRSEFALLGAQDLSALTSALDSAASRTKQLGEEAANAKRQLSDLASSFQDQIDQINGNQDAIEARRFAADLQRAKDLAAATGDLNGTAYNDAVAAANALHQLKLKQIREQAAAQSAANSQASQSGGSNSTTSPPKPGQQAAAQSSVGSGSVVVNINLNGQTVTVRADSQAQANQLIEILRRAALASGGGGSISG